MALLHFGWTQSQDTAGKSLSLPSKSSLAVPITTLPMWPQPLPDTHCSCLIS